MYLEYWKLNEKPFDNTPDTKFLFMSSEHQEALKHLTYAITEHKGCALLSGEYGCGKTFLVRAILSELDPERFDLALINFPVFAPGEFLREILFQLGEEAKGGTRLELFHQLSQHFFDNFKRGKSSLVVIDEAQMIEEPRVFEEIRLLLNIQLEDRFLVEIFLVGQPELRERIMEYPHLEQRIGIKYHLHRLNEEETGKYIRHRLGVAGLQREIFTPDAYSLIHKVSYGVARRINNLCDLCLLEGYSTGAEMITEEIIRRVL